MGDTLALLSITVYHSIKKALVIILGLFDVFKTSGKAYYGVVQYLGVTGIFELNTLSNSESLNHTSTDS